MRRALNVLQACHAAYDVVDENAVYTCTGTPHPKDIQRVVESMMSDEFGTAFSREWRRGRHKQGGQFSLNLVCVLVSCL